MRRNKAVVVGDEDDGRPSANVVVLLEPSRSGRAALEHAKALAVGLGSALTVVAVAPKANLGCRSCGGVSTHAYNCAVSDEVSEELHQAVSQLGPSAGRVETRLLQEGTDPPLEEWVAQRGFDLVLLPARRLAVGSPSHPAAVRLRTRTAAEVRVVKA